MGIYRNTMQKEIVYQTLCTIKNHPTADMVFEEVNRLYPTISRSTVFRILNHLVNAGCVLRVVNGSGADSFDHNTEEHCHVKCLKCGRIDDVCVKNMPRPDKEIEDTCGYEITGYELLFEGICTECKKN